MFLHEKFLAVLSSKCIEYVMSINVKETKIVTSDKKFLQLGNYSGKVLLIVNVASYCGFTSQYKDLQKLHDLYSDKGLKILAFPCNDFGNQEPDSLDEIKAFCSTKFNVKFEIFDKVHAKGKTTEPFTTLNKVEPTGDVEWNFEKFLIGKDSEVIARFKSGVNPLEENLIAAIEVALES
tara:strand:+ start:296 stop:832 length:537 start_codon:yes stop_codon:yes gene_type:complete